jgi:hypothetical protein
MTRNQAKTVEPGDIVSYVSKYEDGRSFIALRTVYSDTSFYDEIKHKEWCSQGAVIENHDNYEIHQRVGSNYVVPFDLRDHVMTNGKMLYFDSILNRLIKDGVIRLEPGMHGIVKGVDLSTKRVLIEFKNIIRADRPSSIENKQAWIQASALSYTDKLTVRKIEATSALDEYDDEYLLL